MSNTNPHTSPHVFTLEDIEVETEADEPETGLADAALAAPVKEKKLFSFAKFTLLALFGLVVSLLVDKIFASVLSAFNSGAWGSLIISGLYVAILIGLCGLVLREAFALARLSSLSNLKAEWSLAYASDGQQDAGKALAHLKKHLQSLPSYHSPLTTLASFDADIMNPSDRLALAEKTLFKEADAQAQSLILASAKRATVVTAVSPRALLDMVYVGYESLRLLCGLARLYGVRPASSVLLRLLKLTLGNLALTGGIALTDGLMEQLLGHGAAAKLSARFGEGVLNGFLISRIGLAAMIACRPLNFHALPQPKISEIAKFILATKPRK